jgi:cell division protein FtsI (penicillin-binding protein 3)
VIAKSSNIGAIQIGLKVGDRALYGFERAFGFGRKTGVDLPGESAGQLRRLERWTPSSIGSVAMGHEIGVTTLQLALGGAALANGGLLLKPRLIAARQKPGEEMERFAPEKPERILRPETTIQLRQMMEGVVLHGTGKHAALRGYTAGGKTGSAQIYDVEARAYTHHYNASFLGFAPVANPQIVIAVTVHHTPTGDAGFGGTVAAPVFREIATTALRILDVPKDLPDGTLRTARSDADADVSDLAIAGLGGGPDEESAPAAKPTKAERAKIAAAKKADAKSTREAAAAAAKAAHNNSVQSASNSAASDRSVSSVTPPPVPSDAPAQAGASGVDRRPFFVTAALGPKAPDFRGMTLRAVLEAAAARGLEVEVEGSGLARTQEPAAGTALPRGVRVRVQFAR